MFIFMGGTFDPIHKGHIEAANAVQQTLDSDDCIYLLPAKIPVHKTLPQTTVQQRLDMVRLAIKKFPNILINQYEINSLKPSYTVDTLKHLRHELGMYQPIVMVIGLDSFLTLPQWQGFDELLNLCHLVVLQRPNYSLELLGSDCEKLMQRKVQDIDVLKETAAGNIYFFQQEPFDVSATEIRQKIANRQPVKDFLPDEVDEYIKDNWLYQPK